MSTVPLLAHGGGAPEAALIGLPVLLFGVFFLLERRARKTEQAQDPDGGDDDDDDDTTKGSP